MSLISINDACVDYRLSKDNIVHALKHANIEVKDGEFVSITGKSGSGKSTLLNALGGLLTLTSGNYIFNNQNISKLSAGKLAKFRNENIGFVVQHFALIPDITVYENIALPLKYKETPRKLIKHQVQELCEELEISDKLKALPKQLSGGQCQRVAIARAISCNPSLLLADEPTGALDEETGQKIISIFQKLNSKGMTIIMVTHDEALAKICQREIVIKNGCIVNE